MMMIFFFFFGKWMSHRWMPLVWNMNSWVLKKLDLINFWKQWCKWWFLKISEIDMSKCPSLIKKIFLSVKRSWKITREHKSTWNCMSVGPMGCVPLGKWECHSALLECRIALGHATTLMPWWANSSRFSNEHFTFSLFLKVFYSICDHEILS